MTQVVAGPRSHVGIRVADVKAFRLGQQPVEPHDFQPRVVRDAAELRVKETDRIDVLVTELRALGERIDALPDGFIIEGPTLLHGAVVDSHGDHRLAMALAVASLVADGEVVIENTECIADSFPGFIELMRRVRATFFTT